MHTARSAGGRARPVRGSSNPIGAWLAGLAIGTVALLAAGATAAPSPSVVMFDFPGTTSTIAKGINTAGQIVGFFDDANNHSHGFLRAPGGGFTIIDIAGATDTIANGINAAGRIVGSFGDGSHDHGFIRAPDGAVTTIDVPGAPFTNATAN